jgi:hypothetical protein
VDVLDRLDEMRLAKDKVAVVGLVDLHRLELHVALHFLASLTLASGPR